jgi:hypothetical protein
MSLRCGLFGICVLVLCTGSAKAQFAPAAPPPQQQEPPCAQEFIKLREDAEKKAAAIRTASERKASPQEACHLFNALIGAQSKLLKFAKDNTVWCGLPPQVVVSLKEAVGKVTEIRTRVCQAAAAPQRPSAPSLSDALSSPVPNSNNIKTGRGTFDTLTGNPLEKK